MPVVHGLRGSSSFWHRAALIPPDSKRRQEVSKKTKMTNGAVMSSSKPVQQGGGQNPNPQQGQTQPATKTPAPQQSGGTVIRDWASI